MNGIIWPFPQGSEKKLTECNLCDNPYPYNCEHCLAACNEQIAMDAPVKKIYVGSGEDVCLSTMKENAF